MTGLFLDISHIFWSKFVVQFFEDFYLVTFICFQQSFSCSFFPFFGTFMIHLKTSDSLKHKCALAGVAQWIERRPVNQRGHQSDSQSGHMPGLQARHPVGDAGEATTH